MSIILGIDPGSRFTGIGVIDTENGNIAHLHHEVIKTSTTSLPERLRIIYHGVQEALNQYQPQMIAIEEVFFSCNAQSALKLGQARGAAITACANHGLSVAEYSARQIKQSVVGYGAAGKSQIQQMVKALLKLNTTPPSDAADALAIAICHCHQYRVLDKLNRARITAGDGA